MPHNSKFSPEEKVKAVEDYLNGKRTSTQIVQSYSINKTTLKRWVNLYKSSGIDGLISKATNKHYPAELKQKAIEEYIQGQASAMDLVVKYRVSNDAVVRRWIQKYNSHGEFKSKKTGSEIYMAKGRPTSFEERQEIVSYCISHGMDYRSTMEQYGVSYQQIYNWVKKYKAHGTDGLHDRRGKAKPEAWLTEEDRLRAENRMLREQLKQKEMENDVIKKRIEVEGRWS